MIEIRLPRQTLFLTEKEMTSLLAKEPDLWKRALRRGKGILRRRQADSRRPQHLKEAERQLAKEVVDVCHLEP
ncbi:MAG: hypothetical protein ACOX2T_03250 [bacterium]|jgi:hypothetical protein